jgi:CubicO group peptidase (beta-lactamase class C family)
MRLFATSSFVFIALVAFGADQQQSSASSKMQAFVDRGDVSGIVTMSTCNGKTVGPFAVGFQDVEGKKAMRPDSIFQVMSMTKPVTSVGIMMLVEEGLLSLSDPIEKHLPEFKGVNPAGWRAPTVRDLMTHTSGMIANPPPSIPDLYTKMNRTLAEAVALYGQHPLVYEPGTKWMYSNTGIATLGRLIEVRSGKSYEQFLEERVFKPLGMKDSHFYVPEEKKSRVAFVYGPDATAGPGKLKRAPGTILGGDSTKYRPGAVYPAPEFGLYSTAADLNAFYQAMLNGKLLSKASMRVMTAIHTPGIKAGWNAGAAFGLGWEVVDQPEGYMALASAGTYYHGGAFGTFGWVDAPKKLTGVFLVQSSSNPEGPRNAFVQATSAACEY